MLAFFPLRNKALLGGDVPVQVAAVRVETLTVGGVAAVFWLWAAWNTVTAHFDLGIVSFALAAVGASGAAPVGAACDTSGADGSGGSASAAARARAAASVTSAR